MTKSNNQLDLNPVKELLKWFQLAVDAKIKNPDAMTLATATRKGIPSARIVLFKGVNLKGLKFFTNYESRKAQELNLNPKAAVVFYWSALDRQIRVEGQVRKLPRSESDAYWNSRPRESRINALASDQSTVITGRTALEKKANDLNKKYLGKDIPRPVHWGGYCLIPTHFEFWIAGEFRLHDRFVYVKNGKKWKQFRLSP